MSIEESKNKHLKSIYLRQNMGSQRLFKPHHDCSARFLSFCSFEAEIVTHEFYGIMCKPCFSEAVRIHEKAMREPCKMRSWKDATFHALNTSEENKKKSEACSKKGYKRKGSGRRRNFSKVYTEVMK